MTKATAMIQDTPQTQALATPQVDQAASPSAFSAIFNPPDRRAAYEMCVQLSKERWLPASMQNNPMFIAIALAFGERFGLQPMSALTNIAVINGKPSLFGPMALAVCRRADPTLGYSEKYHYSGEGDKRICVGCEVTVTRTGHKPHIEVFLKADAERAQLWNKKGPWQQYPQRMFMARARGFALTTVYPDVLSGYITSEEAEDYPSRQEARPPTRRRSQIGPHPDTVVDAAMFNVKLDASQNETPETSAPHPDDSDRMTLIRFQKMIDAAQSTAQLKAVADMAKHLNEDDRAMSRDIFRARQAQLRASEKKVVDSTVAQEHHATYDDDRRRNVVDRIMGDDNLPSEDEIPTPEEQGWEP